MHLKHPGYLGNPCKKSDQVIASTSQPEPPKPMACILTVFQTIQTTIPAWVAVVHPDCWPFCKISRSLHCPLLEDQLSEPVLLNSKVTRESSSLSHFLFGRWLSWEERAVLWSPAEEGKHLDLIFPSLGKNCRQQLVLVRVQRGMTSPLKFAERFFFLYTHTYVHNHIHTHIHAYIHTYIYI